MAKGKTGAVIATACATWFVGVPLAIAALIWGSKFLVWLLGMLPQ